MSRTQELYRELCRVPWMTEPDWAESALKREPGFMNRFPTSRFYDLAVDSLRFPATPPEECLRYREFAEEYIPLRKVYDFLSSPRSVGDFIRLRRACYRRVKEWTAELLVRGHFENGDFIDIDTDDYAQVYYDERDYLFRFFMPVAHALSLIPPYSWDERKKQLGWPKKRERHVFSPERKICSSAEEASRRIKDIQSYGDNPLILLSGKWRYLHREQRQTIRLAWELARKISGVVAISVESNEAILARKRAEGKPEEHAPSLEERMDGTAALPWVDLVFPVDCRSDVPVEIDQYHRGVWNTVRPNFFVLGERDHPLFPVFARRCRDFGAVLLWTKERAGTSAAKIIDDLIARKRTAS